MSDGTCPICKENYERSTRKAFILLSVIINYCRVKTKERLSMKTNRDF